MSKILICGDKHLKVTRFEQSKELLLWVNSVVDQEKPDMYIALGDDFDTHAVLRSEILSEYRKHIDYVTVEKNLPMYYILGNHDYYKPKDNTYHALQAFKGLNDNLHIIDKVTDIENFTMVPYMPNMDDFPKVTKEICIAHQTFIGADYGYMRPEAGVNADEVSSSVIISGHVHKRQEFGKVSYPGTPLSFNASDVNQEKGILMFDTDTYEKRFIKAPFPMWRSLEYDLSNVSIDNVHISIKAEVNEKDNWIVKISGSKIDITSYVNSKRFKNLLKKHKITVKLVSTDKDKKKVQIKATTLSSIVDEYVNKVYKGNIDKGTILSKASEIIKKIDMFV